MTELDREQELSRLDAAQIGQLVAIVVRLSGQVSQLGQQIGQVADQVTQTNAQLASLTQAVQGDRFLPEAKLPMVPPNQPLAQPPNQLPADPADLLARLVNLESQVQHLTNRVQGLEQSSPRLNLASFNQPLSLPADQEPADQEDIEDEPDEILWDFMEPETKP